MNEHPLAQMSRELESKREYIAEQMGNLPVLRSDIGMVIYFDSASNYGIEFRQNVHDTQMYRVNGLWYHSPENIPTGYRKARTLARTFEGLRLNLRDALSFHADFERARKLHR